MEQIIKKYIQRIKVDFPEDDKLYMDLQEFAKELEQSRQAAVSGSLPVPLIKWWESHRPEAWDLNEHLKFPSVNCPTETEQELAMYVAESYYNGNDR